MYAKRSRSSRFKSKSRRKSGYSKKRSFKANTRSVVSRVKKVEKKVKLLAPELKFRFFSGAFGAYIQQIGANPEMPSSFGMFTTFTHGIGALDQGATREQRVGLDIVPKSSYMKLEWLIRAPDFSLGYPLPKDRSVRVLIIQTKGVNSGISDITVGGARWLLPFVDPQSNRTKTYLDPTRLKSNGIAVLYDRRHRWQTARVQNSFNIPNSIGYSTAEKEITTRIKPRYPMVYLNGGGTSLQNPIYAMWIDDIDSITSAPTVTLTSWSHWFKDNC